IKSHNYEIFTEIKIKTFCKEKSFISIEEQSCLC
ncbi:unnamed protein product, partial [marine sediment metagenome]